MISPVPPGRELCPAFIGAVAAGSYAAPVGRRCVLSHSPVSGGAARAWQQSSGLLAPPRRSAKRTWDSKQQFDDGPRISRAPLRGMPDPWPPASTYVSISRAEGRSGRHTGPRRPCRPRCPSRWGRGRSGSTRDPSRRCSFRDRTARRSGRRRGSSQRSCRRA
jgi:hypothetical protein